MVIVLTTGHRQQVTKLPTLNEKEPYLSYQLTVTGGNLSGHIDNINNFSLKGHFVKGVNNNGQIHIFIS